jgi:RNA recognition motif-containing protein
MKLFVGNLSYDTSTEDLRALFAKVGEVTDATVVTDPETGRSKGFGFVTMPISEQAERAIRHVNGSRVRKRVVVVEPSLTQGSRREPGRRLDRR